MTEARDRPATTVAVIIPALDEEGVVGEVVRSVPRNAAGATIQSVIVVDNGSVDETATVARDAGALVISEAVRGYGRACLAGLEFVASNPPDIVAFMDADGADDPADLDAILAPIVEDRADLVIGSRALGARLGRAEAGALMPQAVFGNWLACTLIHLRWGVRFTDLGPFRAIRWTSLAGLRMSDRTFGWTVEMQAKAARDGVRWREVPAGYRRRVGKSKISGTIMGSTRAGAKILWTIGRLALRRGSDRPQNPTPEQHVRAAIFRR